LLSWLWLLAHHHSCSHTSNACQVSTNQISVWRRGGECAYRAVSAGRDPSSSARQSGSENKSTKREL
jgi:hypothetical protein